MANNTSSTSSMSTTTAVSFDECDNPVFPLDLSGFDAIATSCTPAVEKRDGKKTDKPLIDKATGKRIYWTNIIIAPKQMSIGQDRLFLFGVPSEGAPVAPVGKGTPVEFVNPRIALVRGYDGGEFKFVFDALKPKKAN